MKQCTVIYQRRIVYCLINSHHNELERDNCIIFVQKNSAIQKIKQLPKQVHATDSCKTRKPKNDPYATDDPERISNYYTSVNLHIISQ